MLHDSVQAHSEIQVFNPSKKKILPLRLDLSLLPIWAIFISGGYLYLTKSLLHQFYSTILVYHHIISRLDKINPAWWKDPKYRQRLRTLFKFL